jgi:hypothetical protein
METTEKFVEKTYSDFWPIQDQLSKIGFFIVLHDTVDWIIRKNGWDMCVHKTDIVMIEDAEHCYRIHGKKWVVRIYKETGHVNTIFLA